MTNEKGRMVITRTGSYLPLPKIRYGKVVWDDVLVDDNHTTKACVVKAHVYPLAGGMIWQMEITDPPIYPYRRAILQTNSDINFIEVNDAPGTISLERYCALIERARGLPGYVYRAVLDLKQLHSIN